MSQNLTHVILLASEVLEIFGWSLPTVGQWLCNMLQYI